jgi:hypothetical protein
MTYATQEISCIIYIPKFHYYFHDFLIYQVSGGFTTYTCAQSIYLGSIFRYKWVPVTAAWHFVGLRMEERPQIWRVAGKMLDKESRTADKGWSSTLGVRQTTPHRKTLQVANRSNKASDVDTWKTLA